MKPLFRSMAAVTTAIALSAWSAGADAQTVHHPKHDYPTAARADYVIGCLASNSFHREMLDKCACGIDVIADLMSYSDYEKADTVLRMQQGGLGDRGALLRDTPTAKDVLEKLRRAQAEVNLRCS